MIEQVPGASRLAELPATAQKAGVVLAKLTGRLDDAVADRLTVPALNEVLPGAANEIVCGVSSLQPVNEAPVIFRVSWALSNLGTFDCPVGAKPTTASIAAAEDEIDPASALR